MVNPPAQSDPADGDELGPLALRAATAEDAPALLDLIEGAYRGDSARRGWTHEADLLGGQRTDLEDLLAIIAGSDRVLLLAEADGAPFACLLLVNQGEGAAYLGLLTVDPARQGTGLGRRLLAAAEPEATARFGANRIRMTVIQQRPELIAWYERRGYGRTGETAPFPLDDPRFGLPKRQDLAFVVLQKRL